MPYHPLIAQDYRWLHNNLNHTDVQSDIVARNAEYKTRIANVRARTALTMPCRTNPDPNPN